MRPPHFTLTLSLPILLLPLFTTALPQDPAPLPSSEATTTSTSTSTLTVTRTLIRGTSVVIATLADLPAQATALSSNLPDIAASTVASDILVAAPYPSSSSINGASNNGTAPSATGTGNGKPVLSTTGPAPAVYTGGAATMGMGGNVVGAMTMAMAAGWLLTGAWL